MAADLEPAEALERKAPFFGCWLRAESGRWAEIVAIDERCPRCNSPVVCAYADTSGAFPRHTFAHVCLSAACDWCEEHSEVTANVDDGGELPQCSFCGREV